VVPFVYHAANWITRYLLLPLFGRVSVQGLENLPRSGPLVIASNHLSDADPGVISTRIPRHIVYMTKDELFHVPVLAQFLRAYGSFPVRRNEADLGALRQANEALKRGHAVCIFPEGTRSGPDARLLEAWPGAALIALRNDTPILPIAITGTQHLGLPWMFLHPTPRNRITLTIGQPFVLPRPARVNTEAARAGTQRIMEKIAALLPPAYRGYYGNASAEGAPTMETDQP
jgi:1-acyl-sn-glycerol-3-phosphate acyltransferase